MPDFFEIAASDFKPPQNPLLRYKVEVRYRPLVPDNVNKLHVFKCEEHIKRFMEVNGNFQTQ